MDQVQQRTANNHKHIKIKGNAPHAEVGEYEDAVVAQGRVLRAGELAHEQLHALLGELLALQTQLAERDDGRRSYPGRALERRLCGGGAVLQFVHFLLKLQFHKNKPLSKNSKISLKPEPL